jgi:NosR/NirI family nitrous oxide reductase transcriptional regulator
VRADGKGILALIYLFIFLSSIILKVEAAEEPVLLRFSIDFVAAEVYPGADRLAEVEGESEVVAAYKGDAQIGYVFVNSDYVNSTGYSGKPIHLVIAIDKQAVIRNVILVEHHEPIVLIGIPEKDIVAVLDKYTGMNIVCLSGAL